MRIARQRGGAITTFLIIVAIIFLAIIGMKVVPAYTEYMAIKRTLQAMAANGELDGATRDVRAAFSRRAMINDIKSVTAEQLEINKEGGLTTVTANYASEIPLFANIKLVIDFSASSLK